MTGTDDGTGGFKGGFICGAFALVERIGTSSQYERRQSVQAGTV